MGVAGSSIRLQKTVIPSVCSQLLAGLELKSHRTAIMVYTAKCWLPAHSESRRGPINFVVLSRINPQKLSVVVDWQDCIYSSGMCFI